jgi:hypothetical protein
VDPGDPAVLDRVLALGPAPADLGRAGLVVEDPAVLVLGPAPADLVLVVRGLVDLGRAGLVVTGRAGRAGLVVMDLAGLGDPVGLGQVDLVDPADIRGLAGPVVLDRVDRVDLADPADIRGLAAWADPVDLAGLDLAGRVDLGNQGMDQAGRVDPGDLGVPVGHTHPGVRTSGVAPRWAAPGTCRTGSARRITGRRLRPGNTDSAGTMGVPPVLRRRSGTDRRPRVAGAVHRLPVVGTVHGMVRRVTGASRSVITGRSITTGTTRSRCSTRYSVDGASGSSVSGSRCTDLTASTPD